VAFAAYYACQLEALYWLEGASVPFSCAVLVGAAAATREAYEQIENVVANANRWKATARQHRAGPLLTAVANRLSQPATFDRPGVDVWFAHDSTIQPTLGRLDVFQAPDGVDQAAPLPTSALTPFASRLAFELHAPCGKIAIRYNGCIVRTYQSASDFASAAGVELPNSTAGQSQKRSPPGTPHANPHGGAGAATGDEL
jgi:hypothetical protein